MPTENQKRIEALNASIRSLQETLPYADGGAHSQDKRRIAQLRQELKALQMRESENARTQ